MIICADMSGYQIIRTPQYLKFPIICLLVVLKCLIWRKTEEHARLTLIGCILQKLSRKCQLTFLTPKKVLRFYQHIYTNKLNGEHSFAPFLYFMKAA